MTITMTRTTGIGGYPDIRFTLSDPAAQEAWDWLAANKQRMSGPRWSLVRDRFARLRPQCANEDGEWIYVDGIARDYAHGDALMALWSDVQALRAATPGRSHRCAGSVDGCREMVATSGARCARCAHDA